MRKLLLLSLFIIVVFKKVDAQDYRWREVTFPAFDTMTNPYPHTTSCAIAPDSKVYVPSSHGVFVYDNGLNYRLNTLGSIALNFSKIIFESANNYWLGSDSALFHWDGSNWNTYNKFNTPFFYDKKILPIKHDSISGKTYFYTPGDQNTGSLHSQVCIFDGTTWTSIDSTNSPLMKYISTGIDVDAAGKIYVASSDTIAVYDGINWSFILVSSIASPPFGTPPISIDGLKVSDNGKLFTIVESNTGTYSLATYDFTNTWSFYIMSILGTPINPQLEFDTNKNLWINPHPGLAPSYDFFKFDGLDAKRNGPWSLASSGSSLILALDKDFNVWSFYDYPSNNYVGFCWFNENGFNTVSGNVFIDNNSNGVKDAGEVNLKNQIVHESNKNLYCNSDTSGYVLGFVDTSGSYNISLVTPVYWHTTNVPSTYTVVQTNNNQKDTGIDFGIAPNGVFNDLSVNGYMSAVRPGLFSWIHINYKNTGTTTISDTISVSLDPNLMFISANLPPTVISGNYLQWVFTNLAAFEDGAIRIFVATATTLNIGNTVTAVATIGTSLNDTTPANNVYAITRIVTGSYDPNLKEVEPKGTGTTGNIALHQQLSYTVEFQNTGNDTAFKVVIKDSVDSDLDLSTFDLVGSSHLVSYKINSERLVTFTFNNILLPDSTTNELLSHGFVKYTISPIANSVSGNQIKNVAGIYFDYNTAIETNTTLNTLSLAAGIPSVNYGSSSLVYPNPFSGQTTIRLDGNKSMEFAQLKIFDLTGSDVTAQLAISKSNALTNCWTIGNKNLTKGIYIYKVFDYGKQIAAGKLNVL